MRNTTQTSVETQGVNTEKIFHDIRLEVIESFPSIFSKDDVILLIDRIQKEVGDQSTPKITSENIENLRSELIGEVQDIITNYDYDSDIDVELDGREIRVDFNYRLLKEDVGVRIKEVIDEKIG